MKKLALLFTLVCAAPAAWAQYGEVWFSAGQSMYQNSGLGTSAVVGGSQNDFKLGDGCRFAFRIGFNGDGLIGHGGIVVFDDSVNMAKQARFAMEFCAIESCGKCTPCRIGSTRGMETIDKIINGENVADNIDLVQDLCEVMRDGSLCALGGLTPMPVMSALEHFPEDFTPAHQAAAE